MKQLMMLLVAFLSTFSLFAQRDNTLVNTTGRVGLFFSTSMEFSDQVNDVNSYGSGGFGIVLSDFFIGGYGSAGANFDELIYNDDIERIELAHGGLWLGYTPFQSSVIHPFVSLRTGWGAVGIEIDDFDYYEEERLDNVFVMTPELGLEVNIFRFLRVSGSATYRQVKGIDNANYATDAFDGLGGRVALKIGWFGRNRKHHHRNDHSHRRRWWKFND